MSWTRKDTYLTRLKVTFQNPPQQIVFKMTRFATLCYAITAAAAAIGTTAFQPPPSLLLPTLRHHDALARFSSTHDSITTHNNHNHGQYQLEQKTWMFQDKYPIAYEVASAANTNNISNEDVTTVPILLLNGFGVGSFHQHRLMRQLLIEQQKQQSKQRFILYGIDYLGQGKSWPADPQDGNSADEYQLGYSADMWLDQLASFVQEVVISPATDNDDDSTTTITASNSISNNNKVHLVGNSVGGYLATILTHKYPQLISSLTLLNATPVWGLNLPGWDGKLPAPAVPKAIGRQMFNLIRNEDVIRQYLEAAYVRGEAFDGTFEDGFDGWGCIASSNADNENGAATGGGRGEPLGAKIRACTEGNGGHAAFASILWSAPASGISFYEALQQVPVDVLLLFGGDDPWCTEAVGKRMHVTLASRRDGSACRFVTLKNVGHCPNHEAPTAVAQVLMPWLDADDSEERRVVPLDSISHIQEPWGEVVIREVSIEESESLGLVDRMVSSMVG
eukprot:scaffold4339_cov100-Skeletonema_dohrnii-CCMP3373.AAC.1